MRLTRDLLIEQFHTACAGPTKKLVGAEFERHLLLPSGHPLPYKGHGGVGWLLEQYASRHGWERTVEGEHTIALKNGKARITLEPGAQLELSGSPFESIAPVEMEAQSFNRNVAELLKESGAKQVMLGFTPLAEIAQIEWVPKGRYSIMRSHLADTGDLAHHMMKGTCAVQASYDFDSEADCAAKVQLATKLGPLTTAMFANSPVAYGKLAEQVSYRGHIWTRTDPARTGFPAAANAFSFEAWVDYLLASPMMFYHFGEEYLPARGRSFSSWMNEGYEGRYPTLEDWDLHLTSVFPEVRVKHAIEVRGADCVPHDLSMSFVALFFALFYDEKTRDYAAEIAEEFTNAGSHAARFSVACSFGLKAEIGSVRFVQLAERLLDAANAGLQRLAPADVGYLKPLHNLVSQGESPGHVLLRELDGDFSAERIIQTRCLPVK